MLTRAEAAKRAPVRAAIQPRFSGGIQLVREKGVLMKGSCLCGTCVFEIPDRPGPVNKCHCTRCRKQSGTGSNAVFWLESHELNWVTGTEVVRSFSMADGWESVFCGQCGSPLPRYIADEQEWIVPAGLMDSDPGVAVRQHIFVANKPSWEVIGDSAPRIRRDPVRANERASRIGQQRPRCSRNQLIHALDNSIYPAGGSCPTKVRPRSS